MSGTSIISEGVIIMRGNTLRVLVLSAAVLSASSFVMRDSPREKRTVKIPAHLVEPLVPILMKLLPEPVLMQIQGLLVSSEKLVAEDAATSEGDSEWAVLDDHSPAGNPDQPAEATATFARLGLAQFQELHTALSPQ